MLHPSCYLACRGARVYLGVASWIRGVQHVGVQWYYQIMGEACGPVSFSHLQQLARRGVVSRDTWVRQDVDGEWIAADHLAALFTPTTSTAGQGQKEGQLAHAPSEAGSPLARHSIPAKSGKSKAVIWEDPHRKVTMLRGRRCQRYYYCPHCNALLNPNPFQGPKEHGFVQPPLRLRAFCPSCDKPIRWSPSQFCGTWGEASGCVLMVPGAILVVVLGAFGFGPFSELFADGFQFWMVVVVALPLCFLTFVCIALLSGCVAWTIGCWQLFRESMPLREKWREFCRQ